MQVNTHKYLTFYTLILLFIILSFVILYQARILLIPMSFALLISFMYHPVGVWVEKRAGRAVSISFCLLLLFAFGVLLFQLLVNSLSVLYNRVTGSKERIFQLGEKALQYLDTVLPFRPEQQKALFQQVYENMLTGIIPLLKQTISFSAGTLAMILIIPIFVALMLYYRELMVRFTLMVVPENQIENFKSTIKEMTHTYFQFAKGMAVVYLIVGTLNSIGFLLLGLPNAIYFGILASLLTFFPYIGIFIGGLAAVVVAWTTYNTIWHPLGVVAILGVVQYLEANVIFPVAVGTPLKLNPLATLIAIILGGIVWGGAGLVLFVPFAAILKLLADRVEELRPLAVLLGPDSRNISKAAQDP